MCGVIAVLIAAICKRNSQHCYTKILVRGIWLRIHAKIFTTLSAGEIVFRLVAVVISRSNTYYQVVYNSVCLQILAEEGRARQDKVK
jgi:hypothetical protein